MEAQSQRRSILLALIVSLLIHIGILFLVTIHKNNIIIHNLLSPETLSHENQKKYDDEWAETKTRASHPGAPVLFQDVPEEDTPIYEPAQDKTEPTSSHQQPLHNELDTQEKTEHIQKTEDIQQTPETKTKEETNHTPIEQAKKISLEAARAPISKIPQKLAQTSTDQQHSQSAHQPTGSIKRPPTLAQLTHGFLNQPKDEGSCTVKMLGNKDKTPSAEQMKYETYLQKLGWCFQNSFNINQNRLSSSELLEGVVVVYIALNKDGMLKELRIAQSSGNIRLDQFVLFVLKDASSSFPPVPHYLPHDPFTLLYSISVNTHDNASIRRYKR